MVSRLAVAALAALATGAVAGCTRSPAPPAARADAAAISAGTASAAAATDARVQSLATLALPDPADRDRVPGFAGATAWLNVDHALSLDELRGKVVLVDFWTSCCINCIHTLPVLHTLEESFAGQPFAVVGVHSPKFDAESERERLSAAVRQYGITHPIAVDGSMKVWNAWGVSSWPSLFVLDTKGRVVWAGRGEPDPDELARAVASAIVEAKNDGTANAAPVAGLRPEKDDTGPLAFPGKVLALADGGYAIADTAHHRVVITDAAGKTTAVAGSGLAGRTDGNFGEASFHKPQGMAELDGVLYVADTENHEIRAIDRRARTVATVAGTGVIGHSSLKEAGAARETALRSPWDLAAAGGTLYVALAGSHQIAAFDPKTHTIRPFAGDGRERRKDGVSEQASFAQPSGLATDGRTTLWVADSETSSVRALDIASRNVRTLVGKDLFVFGDVDGDAEHARLKHPIGITYANGALYVADTYNSKIKKVDPASGRTETWATGLFEPAGLTTTKDGTIVVADTDRHRLVFEPSGRALVPAELSPPARGVSVARAVERPPPKPEERLALAATGVADAPGAKLHVVWQVPAGTSINPDAPYHARWAGGELRGKGSDIASGLDVPLAGTEDEVAVDVDLVICDVATHRVCVPVRRELDVALRRADRGATPATVATVTAPLPAAKP